MALASLVAWPGAANAALCSSSTGQPGIVLFPVTGPVTVDPSVAVGTTLVRPVTVFSATPPVTITCPAQGTSSVGIQWTGAGPYLGNNIYATNIPGIGVRLFWDRGATVPFATTGPASFKTATSWGGSVAMAVVKTGPITRGGSLTGEVATLTYPTLEGFQIGSVRINGSIVINPGRPTCAVTTPSVAVRLGNVSKDKFKGVGSTSQGEPFNIGLNCAGGITGITTAISVTLTDPTNPDNRSNTLSLSPASTASGVGIQILKGATVLSYGPDSSAPGTQNQWSAGSSGNGLFDVPLIGRYVQTSPTIKPGSASGRATFTLSYQ
ncbi:fimbrial protein [Variovorax sp. EBFNA2]|uniref:fimbrial protein n=1 Tax=Variovorax sp. EBFNA2 TaxID=3342097 RepID=UPI0029BFEBC5|nr:fimbrial protein [Variovorax boronicumulans]WPG40098.1 fimbrial protein [Variovorax boronicumulans]